MVGAEQKRATAGFAVSLIAGIIILIVDIAFYSMLESIGFLDVGSMIGIGFAFDILFYLGLLWAILVIVGAALIWTGRTTAGGVLVIIFSILSVFSLALGGFILGLILGIIGGALGIAKK